MIAGGETAAPHEFPHQVSLWVSTLWLLEHPICDGAVIDPSWVLTSATCVKSVAWYASAFILAGRGDLSAKSEEGQQRVAVLKMHIHEKYMDKSSSLFATNDIALLQLKTPLTYTDSVQPAQLPFKGLIPTGGECTFERVGRSGPRGRQGETPGVLFSFLRGKTMPMQNRVIQRRPESEVYAEPNDFQRRM